MSEWLPIETAPKDGEWILMAWDGKTTMARWVDNSMTVYPWAGWTQPSLFTHLQGKPTHWMPLPEPPKDESGDDIHYAPCPICEKMMKFRPASHLKALRPDPPETE